MSNEAIGSFKMIRNKEGLSSPAFHCDQCGKQIDPEDGMIVWDDNESGTTAQQIVCRGRRCDDQVLPLSQGLETGLMYFLHNSGYLSASGSPTAKLRKAFERAMRLSGI
jgi:hypothetical protein